MALTESNIAEYVKAKDILAKYFADKERVIDSKLKAAAESDNSKITEANVFAFIKRGDA